MTQQRFNNVVVLNSLNRHKTRTDAVWCYLRTGLDINYVLNQCTFFPDVFVQKTDRMVIKIGHNFLSIGRNKRVSSDFKSSINFMSPDTRKITRAFGSQFLNTGILCV